ncbi:MAG: hypothetical protein AB7N24_17350 [Dehalococcoidia bacterium]
MRAVGGYRDYLALCEHSERYEQVVIALAGEADASRMEAIERKARANAAANRRR